MTAVRLVLPSASLHDAWLDMAREFPVGHIAGASIGAGWSLERLSDPGEFAAWVGELADHERGVGLADGFVPASLRWVAPAYPVDEVEPADDPARPVTRLLGTIQLRHELNDYLRRLGGHIGYAVRPSARRQGVATGALRLMLAEAAALGTPSALLTCDEDNLASAGTIERRGGLLEDIVDPGDGTARKRRYWVPTAPASTAPATPPAES